MLSSLSERIQAIPQALSIYINQLAHEEKMKGSPITTLSLGEAFFDIPQLDFHPEDIAQGYHYSDSRGVLKLREKIAGFYGKQYNSKVDPHTELLITTGSKAAIFMAMQALLNPQDEVVIFEPAWLSYPEQARLAGAVPCFIPYDCPIESFSKHFTSKTKLLVINNPNNPSGKIFTREELSSIYEQCQAHGIYLLVDEAYSDFLLDEQFVSIAQIAPAKEGIVVVNSLSKNMGLSGWRIGYLIAAPVIIDAVLKLNQHMVTCAPSLLQLHLARYFDDILSETLPQAKAIVEKRRNVAKYLDHLGLKRLEGEAAFYFFIHIGNFPDTSFYLVLYLLFEHRIAVVPGSAYGQTTERFIRLSIGTEPLDAIYRALDIIKQVIEMPHFDKTNLLARIAKDDTLNLMTQ